MTADLMHDPAVVALIMSLLGTLRSVFRTRTDLALEDLALREQLANLRHTSGRPPTATFHVLYVFLVLSHDRRRVVHWNVTSHPSAQWAAQQIIEAFSEETAPKYMIRDRDGIYGEKFRGRVQAGNLATGHQPERSFGHRPDLQGRAASTPEQQTVAAAAPPAEYQVAVTDPGTE